MLVSSSVTELLFGRVPLEIVNAQLTFLWNYPVSKIVHNHASKKSRNINNSGFKWAIGSKWSRNFLTRSKTKYNGA